MIKTFSIQEDDGQWLPSRKLHCHRLQEGGIFNILWVVHKHNTGQAEYTNAWETLKLNCPSEYVTP